MFRIPERVDSTFRYVLLVAHRAEQLMRGATPKILGSKLKPMRLAMLELEKELVYWDYGPAPEKAAVSAQDEASGAQAF
jgi:DNA-directed RNA polymerase subunit K/omega